MSILGNAAHILIFPFPAQGHMIPLLDLTHQLVKRDLTITILITPKNLPLLNPLLSANQSIKTLVLPFPKHPSIPSGVENTKDMPGKSLVPMIRALGELYNPLLNWFKNHPSPPVAIISDMFLGWTQKLAIQLGIRRILFSPSGAMALSVVSALWTEMPKAKKNDSTEVIAFPKIPNSPRYPWWQVSPIYRSYVNSEPDSDFMEHVFSGNIASWGLVINTFGELERVYLDHLGKQFGVDKTWAVGPLLPLGDNAQERGGSSSVSVDDILSWLQTRQSQKVVYICFGSQTVLTNNQMEALALGLEKSQVSFLWSIKKPTKGHGKENYGVIPLGFEDRVTGRGLIITGWIPQVLILNHPAIGTFLTHCGWNSVLESLVAGIPMLAWPMGADQFTNAGLLVDELRVAMRVCEGGAQCVPNSNELAEKLAQSVNHNKAMKDRAVQFRRAALNAIEEGNSIKDLDALVKRLESESKQGNVKFAK